MQTVQANQVVVPDASELFLRYTSQSDGKELLAREIEQLVPSGGVLLDLGAGDGKLTSRIAPHFSQIVAVEKNPKYCSKLKAIPNASVVIGDMEENLPDLAFDLALISYSLTGVSLEKSGWFFKELMKRRKPNGKIYVVTFQDFCDWDLYVTPIYAEIGRPRTGGTRAHLSRIESSGYKAEKVSGIVTEMFDETPAKLAETLGFFFTPAHEAYFANIASHHKLLNKLIQKSRYGGVALRCIEEIWEVKE